MDANTYFSNQLQFAVESVGNGTNWTNDRYHQPQIHEGYLSADVHSYPYAIPVDYDPRVVFHPQADPLTHGPSAVSSEHSNTRPTSPETPSLLTRSHSFPSPSSKHLYNRLNSEDHSEIDEIEEPLPSLPPNATDEEKRALTKKRNSRSAKLSRIRRARHVRQLEDELERLKREKEVWRTRAQTIRQLLLSNGLSYPPFMDE